MEIKLISNENDKAKFTIDFTAEEFDAATQAAFKANRNKFRVDGFRKGKAPKHLIERMYGEGVFWEDAINALFAENYSKAVADLDLETIEDPTVDFSEIGNHKPLTMTMEVALYPTIEVKDYMGIEVDKVVAESTEDDVMRELESLQRRNARQVAVEREVKDGDTIIFDFAGTVDGVAFEGGTSEGFELKIGSGSFIPGFEDQLIGKKIGENFDVNVTFPEDYHSKDVAGKDATFACLIHVVKEEQLPELDDEFAKDVSESDTLEELKAATKADLDKRKSDVNESVARSEMVRKVCEANKPEVPAAMVEDEVRSMLQEIDQQLAMSGLNLNMYAQYMNTTEDKMKDEMRGEAESRVATRMVLRAIAEAEKVEASDEDVDKILTQMGAQYGMDAEAMRKAFADSPYMKMVEQDAKVNKAVDLLWENAKINEIEPPADVEVEKVDAE